MLDELKIIAEGGMKKYCVIAFSLIISLLTVNAWAEVDLTICNAGKNRCI